MQVNLRDVWCFWQGLPGSMPISSAVLKTRSTPCSIWVLSKSPINASLGRDDVQLNPPALRMGLIEHGCLLSADRTLLGYGDGVRWVG